MKYGFSNKGDHDLRTHLNRFKDFGNSFDIIEKARSAGISLITFFFERT
jgi:hypothetical protein